MLFYGVFSAIFVVILKTFTMYLKIKPHRSVYSQDKHLLVFLYHLTTQYTHYPSLLFWNPTLHQCMLLHNEIEPSTTALSEGLYLQLL